MQQSQNRNCAGGGLFRAKGSPCFLNGIAAIGTILEKVPLNLRDMKRFTATLTAMLACGLLMAGNGGTKDEKKAKAALPTVNNEAFAPGEVLEWRVHYGFVDAGVARISVEEKTHKIGDRNVWHIVGTGKSKGAFDWFYKVDDRYETYIDEEGVFPWMFVRRVDEGGYTFEQDYVFHQSKEYVETQKGETHEVPVGVQDMLSAFYYARTMDLDTFTFGDTLTVETFVDGKLWPLQCKYVGDEDVTVDAGEFTCMKFAPIVQKGRVFKEEDDLSVWITKDKNRIPVLAQAKIMVGSIKMELQGYENLSNPIATPND